MMKYIFHFIIIVNAAILSAALPLHSTAQTGDSGNPEENYRAVNWTIHDGLSNGMTNFILKDLYGFVWFGTNNGLNRFDGNLFKKYTNIPHDTRSISGDMITGIVEDSLHNIWIGSNMGLTRYDIRADTFTNMPRIASSAVDYAAFPFWATKTEVYAVDSGFNIVAYNILSYVKRRVAALNNSDSIGYNLSPGYTIFDEKENNLWILRGDRRFPGGGLLRISVKDGGKQIFQQPCFRHMAGHEHASEAMRYDRRRNSIWINSSDGLLEFTLADNQFHQVQVLNKFTSQKSYGRWVGLDLDIQGKVWLATDPQGILIYDPKDQSLRTPFPADSGLQLKVSNFNSVLYCDRDGITWCGLWRPNGVFQIIPFSSTVKLYRPDPKNDQPFGSNSVVRFSNAGPGKVWVETYDDQFRFDSKTGLIEATDKMPPFEMNGIIFRSPFVTDSNAHKALFLALHEWKLYEGDLNTNKSIPVVFIDSLGKPISSFSFSLLNAFKNGWIVTVSWNDKDAIFLGDMKTSSAQEVVSIPKNSFWILNTTDGERFYFLNYPGQEYNMTFEFLNGKGKQVHNPTDSLKWTGIFYNQKDYTYWVAAENKIFHYNREFQLIRTYTREDGMPDNIVIGLIADDQGNIWFHSDRAIFQLNLESGRISMLSEKDGFVKQYLEIIRFTYKDESGDIYFPTGNFGSGFDRIIPRNYTNPPSAIYLQSLEINQKPYKLSTGVNNLQDINLNYNENRISLETGILDFYSKGSSHMRYKLETEGREADWQYGPANYTIRFEGLEPGNYTLRMQASTAALQFNGPEKILAIHIHPPWWKTWWAIGLYILAFLYFLWKFIQYRSNNLKQRNIELEEKVIHRTRELKLSLEELRTTQDQLVQREKMASLGELTAGIAHEIQNPLNFVNNFSEINAELIDEMNEELQAGHVDEAAQVAGMVKDNNLKINHHGKRADSIVKGMLQHSRTSSGQKEPTNINSLTDEYMRLSYHGLRAKDKSFNVTMITNFDERAEPINMVPQDIGRVLLNLFNNSFYSVNEKQKLKTAGYEPTLWVSTKQLGKRIEIRIRDNGMGIPQKILDKIFQPFFTTKPTGEGTGLGLSISYEIITKGHAGELKMESTEGEYVECTIILPVNS